MKKETILFVIVAALITFGINVYYDSFNPKYILLALVFYCTFSSYYIQSKLNNINEDIKNISKNLKDITPKGY